MNALAGQSQGFPQVPEKDAAGNAIPAWKRQMMARRAAEKAKKDLEKELAGEAERRRAAALPAWKRQLLQRREGTVDRLTSASVRFEGAVGEIRLFGNYTNSSSVSQLKWKILGMLNLLVSKVTWFTQ